MKRLLLAASALVLVLAACGGSQRVPKRVSEIDIRTLVPDVRSVTDRPRVFSRSITDPSEVERIIGWFDALKPPGTTSIACRRPRRERDVYVPLGERRRTGKGKQSSGTNRRLQSNPLLHPPWTAGELPRRQQSRHSADRSGQAPSRHSVPAD